MTAREHQPRQWTLDIVRGLAILLVLAFHLDAPSGIAAIDALRPVARAGWCGVDLFFVLSGFLVGHMVIAEAASPGGFRPKRFFVRRAWRLLPALYAYLAVLVLIGGRDAFASIAPVLIHIQNYATTAPSHLWSLAVEEHFYLAAAFVLPWLGRGGGDRVIAGLLAIIAGSLGLRLCALATGTSLLHLQWQTQYRIDALALGVLLAAVRFYRPALFAWATRQRTLFGGLAATGFAIVVICDDAGPFRHGAGFLAADLASAALVLALYGARVPIVLTWPARGLAALGTIAYSLYIWHASIARVIEGMASVIGAPWLVLTLKYVAAIAVSALLYRVIERPAMRLRDAAPILPDQILVIASTS